jgi:hypothetical protein
MSRILRLLPTALASLGLLTACAGQNAAIGNANVAPIGNDATSKQTFHFTGIVQTFQVPSGVDKVTITAEGAGTPSARGGLVKATIGVNPGDALNITVGGAPYDRQGGYNGGADGGVCARSGGCPLNGKGGAGASDVRLGGDELQDRILVAGGAGGRGGPGQYHGGPGGEGGGVAGGRGDNGVRVGFPGGEVGGGGGGGGATQRRGGTRGAAGKDSNRDIVPGNPGSVGTLAIGGSGADNSCSICSITYIYGLAGGAGGGGGGGYYGGGGAGSGGNANGYNGGHGRNALGSGGGGGGGSSFVEAGAQNVSVETGKGSNANGLITISW